MPPSNPLVARVVPPTDVDAAPTSPASPERLRSPTPRGSAFSAFFSSIWSDKTDETAPPNYEEELSDLQFTFQLSREELGRHSWQLLHTLAAVYPEEPSEAQQRDARVFFDVLSRLYPCKQCAKHFQSMLKEFPPQVASRAELSEWLCQAHNRVSARLGKPQLPCSKVEQAWPPALKGDCGCEDDDEDE